MNLQEHINTLMLQFPLLETKRLLLKRVEPRDTEQVFRIRTDCGADQLIGRLIPDNHQEAERMKQKTREDLLSGKTIAWIATLKEAGTVIGTCCFSNIDPSTGHAELSGEMSSANWGKYYAVEGTLAIVSFGLNKLRLSSIYSLVAPENSSAIYLLEKLGFKEEAMEQSNPALATADEEMLKFSRKNSLDMMGVKI